MRDFQGRVAVVTGAGSGIGRALAQEFAAEGMGLVLADLDADALKSVVASLPEHQILAIPTDVRQADSVHALARAAVKRFGKVHLLCNNAGVARHTGQAIWELSLDNWQILIETNVWGVIHGLRAFLPDMLAHGEPAHIVNTASMAGVLAGCGAYGMTKHAVVNLSESLLFDLRQRGSAIGVSCLCPGLVDTAIASSPHDGSETPEQQQYRERIARATRTRGMAPEVVAKALMKGLREDRFYLFPGRTPAEEASLQARLAAVLAERLPSPPPRPSEDIP